MAKKKGHFEDVDTKVNFSELENEILDEWEKTGIVKKYLKRNNGARKRFSFLDGPITANNPMGVHHAWGRTYKDLWQRYFNMQGYEQRFQNGFDCQGLWVEVEVEKELGLKNKKDIENLVEGNTKKSIAKFVELCKKRVFKYAGIQTEQSKRLGYFMDWDNSYFTLSEDNNYSIWHFLKMCHEKGLIYKGRDSVPWCPRCGTAISQHEMLTEDYKEVKHDSVYVAYPLLGSDDSYLLIWTTTPWTLPANIAVVVDPNLTYAYAIDNKTNKKYYLLVDKAKELGLRIIRKVKGKKLVGLTYESPFDELARVRSVFSEEKHRVVEADERILTISEEEGTGLVHIATGAGTEDFALGKKEKLPVIDVIDEEANYLDGLGQLSGKNAKKNPDLVIDILKNEKVLVKTEKYKHRYPACWRCKTELVWRVVDEWYISIDPLREKMKEIAKEIEWIPEFGEKRELDWLNNMHDWLISKSRYWGLALPIWVCTNCSTFQVIGSKDELKEKSKEGWKSFKGKTPHRPWIDEVKIECDRCGSLAERIPDVGNPWLDAGIVPFSTVHDHNNAANPDAKGTPLYFDDKRKWNKWFPADFITESFPGQFKNWFYSLIAMSSVLEGEKPFNTVLGFATLLGEDGRPMHKSWGNSIEFNEGADEIGVDVMRWMYSRQNPADNMLFGRKIADETRRRFHLKLWNVYNFFVTYSNLDGWKPKSPLRIRTQGLKVLDKWFLSKLMYTVDEVTNYLEKFDAYNASALLEEFVDDMSNWYVRRSRERIGPSGDSERDKERFYKVSYYALITLSQMLAPFMPFMPEVIYKNLTKETSVHLSDWPRVNRKINKKLLDQMSKLREIVEAVHAERKLKEIPVRQPLKAAVVKTPNHKLPRALLKIAEEELNLLSLKLEEGKEIKVKLDLEVTGKLEERARTRQLIRKIQQKRKEMGLGLDQKVYVTNSWIPGSDKLKKKVMKKALIDDLQKGRFSVKKAS